MDCFMGRSCIVVNETKLKVDLTKYTEKHQVCGWEGGTPGAWVGGWMHV